jgi:quercetin dioxygenase-like cupin family protein
MGYDKNIMMVKVEFKQDAIGTKHHHPHSQSTYVVSGIFELTIGEETRIIKPGDGFFAPPDVDHEVVCIKEGVLLDAFNPVREDFLK